MKKQKYILFAILIVIFIIAGFFVVKKVEAPVGRNQESGVSKQETNTANKQSVENSIQQPPIDSQEKIKSQTVDPIDGALSRITKKPFGIYITPKSSPVQPEKFSGYHTAIDLETMPQEQDIDVPVKALCDGKLLSARSAGGYGGVAVQSCNLDGRAVTIVYGHIRLSSVSAKTGDQLKAGDFLANLGTGFTRETDGERKHLHLGIHKGNSMSILGYVPNKNQLDEWIDPVKHLNK